MIKRSSEIVYVYIHWIFLGQRTCYLNLTKCIDSLAFFLSFSFINFRFTDTSLLRGDIKVYKRKYISCCVKCISYSFKFSFYVLILHFLRKEKKSIFYKFIFDTRHTNFHGDLARDLVKERKFKYWIIMNNPFDRDSRLTLENNLCSTIGPL